MSDLELLLLRQAAWQQARRTLSWPEKIPLAERMRPTVEAFRIQREQRRGSEVSPGAPAPPAATVNPRW